MKTIFVSVLISFLAITSCTKTQKVVTRVENSVHRAYNATEKGVTKVAKKTSNGLEKGADATERFVNRQKDNADKVATKVSNKVSDIVD